MGTSSVHSGGWRSEVGLVVKHIHSGYRLLVLVWEEKESLREVSPPPVTGRLTCTVQIPSQGRGGGCGGIGAHL